MPLSNVKYSVLDLAPINEGSTASDAFANSIALARFAEQAGYTRYWVAEHHSMPGIASSATAVLIGRLAVATKTIRVGSGGIMLPNHAPLAIAEQFGTLEAMFPGRIDLGIGRAPGTDGATARALRRSNQNADSFPQDLLELMAFFDTPDPAQLVRAIPGAGMAIPIYLLGSSDFSARLAARLGLPFGFASHFAPDYLFQSLAIYRQQFRPSPVLDKPYVIVGVNVFAADTQAEAARLSTSLQQQFLTLMRGKPGKLPPPVENIDTVASPIEKAHLEHMMRYTAIGTPDKIRQQLQGFVESTGADEFIISSQVYDQSSRIRSFEIAADVIGNQSAQAQLS